MLYAVNPMIEVVPVPNESSRRFRMAVHEAGHAVYAATVGIAIIEIVTNGESGRTRTCSRSSPIGRVREAALRSEGAELAAGNIAVMLLLGADVAEAELRESDPSGEHNDPGEMAAIAAELADITGEAEAKLIESFEAEAREGLGPLGVVEVVRSLAGTIYFLSDGVSLDGVEVEHQLGIKHCWPCPPCVTAREELCTKE